jgi:thiol-disulfide isomerase/thioredoxin
MQIRAARLLPCLALILAAVAVGPGTAEAAGWRDLTDRVAPDLTFSEAALGIRPGTTLSSYRSKQVVLLVFWLRDCPHCKRELPKVQRLHELYGRSGLTVISVVHHYALPEVTPVMAARGWTFGVVRDRDGKMALRYGGGRRPGYFIIGIDGRVKASGLSQGALQAELARWRLHELGTVPDELAEARKQVEAGDYGAALRVAEAVGARAGVSAAVRAAVARLKEIAGHKLQNRVDRAEDWAREGKADKALAEYRAIVSTFRGTSLEARARAVYDDYVARLR